MSYVVAPHVFSPPTTTVAIRAGSIHRTCGFWPRRASFTNVGASATRVVSPPGHFEFRQLVSAGSPRNHEVGLRAHQPIGRLITIRIVTPWHVAAPLLGPRSTEWTRVH